MISPHTSPGTRIVVVWNEVGRRYVDRVILPELRFWAYRLFAIATYPPHFQLGRAYVVDQVESNPHTVCGAMVVLRGYPGSYALECFDLAALPECLTSLLQGEPRKVDRGPDEVERIRYPVSDWP